MLSSVLKSKKAINVNIAIMRTFTKLREFSKHYNAPAKKIMEVERKNDKQYKALSKAFEELINESKVVQSHVNITYTNKRILDILCNKRIIRCLKQHPN